MSEIRWQFVLKSVRPFVNTDFVSPNISNLIGWWGIGNWCNGPIECISVGKLYSSNRGWSGMNIFIFFTWQLSELKQIKWKNSKNYLMFFSLDKPALLPKWDRSPDTGRVELLSHQPPVWRGEPVAHLGFCPRYSGSRSLGHQFLQLPAAGAPAQTLPHCSQLCMDVCLHPPSALVSSSRH